MLGRDEMRQIAEGTYETAFGTSRDTSIERDGALLRGNSGRSYDFREQDRGWAGRHQGGNLSVSLGAPPLTGFAKGG